MKLKYRNGGSVSSEKSEFEKAFEAARQAGQATFIFDGKSYSTERADQSEGASTESAPNFMLANPDTLGGVATANPDQDFRSPSMKLYGFEQPDDGPIKNEAYAPMLAGGFQGLGVKGLAKGAANQSKKIAQVLEAYLKKQPLGSATSNIRRNVLAKSLGNKSTPKTFKELAELRKTDPTLAFRSQVRETPPILNPILDAVGVRASRGLPQSIAGRFGTKIHDKLAPLLERYYKTNP
jgi:hypothetical protein